MSTRIAGIDEAGRGPLAGPVVVSAVILDPERPIAGLGDSKLLKASQRDGLAPLIKAQALAWSVIVVDAEEIDRINIFQATMAGMTRAALALAITPTEVLIDGNKVPRDLHLPARAIVKGDASEPCISAASILAKTSRDALMCAFDRQFPGYGFAQHFGYPTPDHLQCLRERGPCPIHRRSFAPVRELLQGSLL
ncbi:MAG: ribonuclease HII [Lysobacterales bacterium]